MEIQDVDFEQAACKTADPELFYSGDPNSIATAKSYCGICPIALQCLTYAMANDEYGVWGGSTLRERFRARNNPKAYKELVVAITN